MLCTVAVEVALGALSLNSRITSRAKWDAAKMRGGGGGGNGKGNSGNDEEAAKQSFESFIDSGESLSEEMQGRIKPPYAGFEKFAQNVEFS